MLDIMTSHKWRQRPNMNIAVNWNVKRLFKQTNKASLQRAGSLRYKYFLLSVILLSYYVIPMEKSHYARFSFLYIQNHTWGDRKVRIKMLSFLYLLLFPDEISSNNAAIYMPLIHCNNACIKRARALQLSLWKHRLTLCGAT